MYVRNRKNCADCNIELINFNSVYSKHNRLARCRSCYTKRYQKENAANSTTRKLKNRYNITLEEYNKLLEFQQNGCAICRKLCASGKKLSVDHDHETNIIRGLLCYNCNSALGFLYEDENIIWNMLEYLKKHKCSKTA